MGYFYKHANRVVPWLGPSSQDSETAMFTLEYLGKQVEMVNSYSVRLSSPTCKEHI
jgi:hypothetical protein